MPPLPPEQFAALKADIAERGVIVPVIVDEFGTIIDGHNRARACRELGKNDYPVEVRSGLSEEEKRALSRKLNALRRYLSRDQVRQLIGEQIKDTPTWSNNRIAGALGVDDKTVATVRASLEATSEIPKLDRLTSADGKTRPRKQAKRPITIDHDDDEDDIPTKKGKPEYTDKEWDDLWAGKGKLAAMKKRTLEHAMTLMKGGVPEDSPVVMALMRDASILVFETNNTKETPGYNPCAGRSEAEVLEWHLFMLFLSFDRAAGRAGGEPKEVSGHVEWLLQHQFQNVAEWLGPEGDKWRGASSEKFKTDWVAFLDQHRNWTLPDVVNTLRSLQSEFEAEKAKRTSVQRRVSSA